MAKANKSIDNRGQMSVGMIWKADACAMNGVRSSVRSIPSIEDK